MMMLADHIKDFLLDLGRRRNWRDRTIRAYRHDLIVAAWRLSMPVAAITAAEIDAVLDDDRLAVSTRHRRAAALTQRSADVHEDLVRHALEVRTPRHAPVVHAAPMGEGRVTGWNAWRR